MAKRKPPVPGHKFAGTKLGVTARCECGWSSCTWYGKGARSSAVAEWHMHVEKCEPKAEKP